ncbi:hypothetical protein [Gallibacterium anatis]|uniref:Lipoprotein n=1 Tax=Gallibacterium anatis 12656/12 TaxID=1195244 RepID=U1GZF1_9PAST|nr:hypothetical protein [Gallibacterium anatis]ERF77888.1 hypothetical protein N561_09105 [Gallibacterium anatis 12656/12]
MKTLVTILASILLSGTLTACSFGGFQPPKPYDNWSLHNEIELYPPLEEGSFSRYLERRKKDMISCGMDFVVGESNNPKANLCLEQKGWYLEGGPVCENELMWDESLCIEWRKKHSKPDAKPWSPHPNSTYIKTVLGLEQAPMKQKKTPVKRNFFSFWN